MFKKKFFKKYYNSLYFLLLLFESCNFDDIFFQKSTSSLKLQIQIDYSIKENLCRAAIPDISINSDNSSEWIFNLENIETGEKYIFTSTELLCTNNKYTIPISPGFWNISVSNDFYEGNISSVYVDDNGEYEICIKVYTITSGSGNVNLKIETGDSKITKVQISQSNTSLDDYFEIDENKTIIIDKENISSGTYPVILSFYIEDKYIFSLPEIINVRKNYTTDKWILNQSETNQLDYIYDGKIILSKEKINLFCGKIFYVKGANGILLESSPNYELQEGSFISPFSSVQDAIDKITTINDGYSTYTIYIDGTIIDNSEHSYSNNNNHSYINISSDIPLKIKMQGLSDSTKININRNSEKQGRIMYISGNSYLEINNIQLTGGYISENGSGIYISTDTNSISNLNDTDNENQNETPRNYNLIISGNTKIFQNYTEDSGGGIYIDNGSVLIKEDSKIYENTALTKGGGICILGLSNKENRILDIDGGCIENNTSLSKSGKNGAGGGLYTQFATVNIQNCMLIKNKAANGGGIDIAQNSIIHIYNSLISENNAIYENGKGGGAIFASGVSSKLYLQKECKIFDNTSATNNGGGIRITSTDVHISDFVYVMNNYYKNSENIPTNIQNNISLAENKKITVDEKLTETQIGINASSQDESATNIVFTKSYGTKNIMETQTESEYANPNLFFFSDNNDYYIRLNEKSECELCLSS